jgi:hypothetical protein
MNLSADQSQQLIERANVLTQVRNQILAEGFKGLILINAVAQQRWVHSYRRYGTSRPQRRHSPKASPAVRKY